MVSLCMAKRENPNDVPKKYRKLRKSFLEHLQKDNNNFFKSFPKEMTFSGREKDENVILIVRSHWIIYLPAIIMALLILWLPLVVHIFLLGDSKSIVFFFGMMIFSVTISVTVLLFSFLKWFYNVNIITDRRVLDLDFKNITSHSLAEARLDKIVDITHKQNGIIGGIFDIGTLYIQTAGTTAEIEFDDIYRARDVQNILHELLEFKKEGEI